MGKRKQKRNFQIVESVWDLNPPDIVEAVRGKHGRRNKFHAVKVEADGFVFDSYVEHERYQYLKLLQQAHEISRLQVKPVYELQPEFEALHRKQDSITYTPDFSYIRDGLLIIEDVKGMKRTEDGYSIRRRLLLYILSVLGKQKVEFLEVRRQDGQWIEKKY